MILFIAYSCPLSQSPYHRHPVIPP